MENITALPPQFKSLVPYMAWALPTSAERMNKRLESTPEEIMAFHAAMVPQIDPVIEYLNQFPLDNIPSEAKGLFLIMMAIAEVGIYAEWFAGASEPPIAAGLGGRIKMRYEPQVTKMD